VEVFGHAYALIFFVLFVAFWAGVIALGVWVALRLTRPRYADSALSILDERFARGDIDQAEYEARKAALQKTS
jgi:putative membrane protein